MKGLLLHVEELPLLVEEERDMRTIAGTCGASVGGADPHRQLILILWVAMHTSGLHKLLGRSGNRTCCTVVRVATGV